MNTRKIALLDNLSIVVMTIGHVKAKHAPALRGLRLQGFSFCGGRFPVAISIRAGFE